MIIDREGQVKGKACQGFQFSPPFVPDTWPASAIRVRIPEGVGYNLLARTSFGRISSELPVTSTGSIGGDSLSGTIGAGGCQLQLTDSNGSIEIAKAQ